MNIEEFIHTTSAIDVMLFLLTAEGKVLAANKYSCEMLGMTQEQLQTQLLTNIVKEEEKTKIPNQLKAWVEKSQKKPVKLSLCGHGGKCIESFCYGNLLKAKSENEEPVLVLRCEKKDDLSSQFLSLTEKIQQLEMERAQRASYERAYTESEEQVRLLLDSAGEAIFGIDMQGKCTFANAACLHQLGYVYAYELLGKNMHELIHHSHADGQSYPIEDCPINKATSGGGHTRHDDEVFFRQDGSYFPVEYFAHPIVKNEQIIGSVVTFQDISERKEIEAELERSQETLERAQAIAHVGSWDWNVVTGALYWTDEIYRIFGFSPQQFEATYEAFLEYIHPGDREAVLDAVNKSVADENIPYDIIHRVIRPDGSERIVNERGKVYRNPKGEAIRMIGTVQDITEKKRADDEIRKLNEELEQRVELRTAELKTANEELSSSIEKLKTAQDQLVQSEKMASLGGLVAGVAHEINTPVGVGVTAITHLELNLEDYTKRYESGQLTRNDFESMIKLTAETSQIIHQNLLRAAELIRSFKQVAVDQTSDEVRDFNLGEYLDEILQSLKPKLKNGEHSVEVECPDGIVLVSHPGALSQIITNLVMNSIIHGFEETTGGLIIMRVTENNYNEVNIEFSDNGCGISSDIKEKIFEPFFTTARNKGGSGLGMHIVYNLVNQKLGGNIECFANEGSGLKYSITIPRHHKDARIRPFINSIAS